MNKVPNVVQKLIVSGIMQKAGKLISGRDAISENQIKKEYAELNKIISWSKRNCSVYQKLEAM